ncbi:MAG TPA: alpha/beta fold hydrolase [Pirellula sp.]|nr:alpha/beta fold hydrolase [Pirellula sp.]
MARTTHRVHFVGHADNLLAGILELPTGSPQGFLLFSHCFTCTKDLKAIVRISRGLADRGWGVLRYDFSGLGNSQGDFSGTNFTTNRLDLGSAAAFLAREYQPPAFLIGHSFGGAASLSMAMDLQTIHGVIAVASPSDTHHLARLLENMNPDIVSQGEGSVSIGGQNHWISRQMLDDFMSFDLKSTIRQISKPILAFHSPSDETVGYENALINCGFDSGSQGRIRHTNRSLISLPNCNHLLTTRDEDCVMVAELTDGWCRRFFAE